ncbi:hypothetical protein BCR39DRAFT_131044 [Naematelia encephala]|uniref:NAD(P)-binding domain-containing protein n=1 Tax=Naematelia encephala TaxID=71784 RepID=A0A1Y2BJ44_9TREE|nr:hypothetical protein BCR39DRAFT_131044 [Naematelia encephala]
MVKLILTGATGNAGSAVLAAAVASPSISHITVLSRRPPRLTCPKVTFVLLPSQSFEVLPDDVLSQVADHRACVWALSAPYRSCPDDEYVKPCSSFVCFRVNHDYTMAAARAFSKLGTTNDPLRFIYLSGMSADQTGQGRLLNVRVKGMTERDLKAIGDNEPGFKLISIRLGIIEPTPEHATTMSWTRRWSLQASARAFKLWSSSMTIPASELGNACIALAEGKGEDKVHPDRWMSNSDVREVATQAE